MRKLLLAAAGIVVLAGAAMLAVWWQSRDPAPTEAPAAPPPVEVPATALPPQAMANVGRMVPGTQSSPPLAPKIDYGPPPVRAPPGTWEAIPAIPRLAGPVGQALSRGLNELQSRLAGCSDEVTQARYGRVKVSEIAEEFNSMDQTGDTPVLMLHVETLSNAVRIVDAPVEARGNAPEGQIACVQQNLIGQTFPAPGVAPGVRQRFIHAIQP